MKEKKDPKPAKNTSPKGARQSKQPCSASNSPSQTPILRHGSLLIELNPGQAKLFEVLASELAIPRCSTTEAPEIDLPAQHDAPGFSDFVLHQLQALADRQTQLEAIWQLS